MVMCQGSSHCSVLAHNGSVMAAHSLSNLVTPWRRGESPFNGPDNVTCHCPSSRSVLGHAQQLPRLIHLLAPTYIQHIYLSNFQGLCSALSINHARFMMAESSRYRLGHVFTRAALPCDHTPHKLHRHMNRSYRVPEPLR